MVILAHDASILGVIDEFPGVLNDWKTKQWTEQTRWTFLKDLSTNKQVYSVQGCVYSISVVEESYGGSST